MHPETTIRIETGARLHFGLLNTSPPFGGLGVMIDQPSTIVELSSSDQFSVDDTIKGRALPIANRIRQTIGRSSLPNVAIRVLQHAPPHSGLGSGTQLSLAIAEGLCRFVGHEFTLETLACDIADRGKRSAVGVHGFFHGGLIFESNARPTHTLNPIQQRVELPDHWRVLLLRPATDSPTVSGVQESKQFARVQSGSMVNDKLISSITDKILPAARAGDFHGFARSVQQYNYASGMLFADAQGGPYNGKVVTDLIEALNSRGAIGVGQSSWGPGVFAWCEDELSANSLAQEFADPRIEVQIVKVKHDGRRLDVNTAGQHPFGTPS